MIFGIPVYQSVYAVNADGKPDKFEIDQIDPVMGGVRKVIVMHPDVWKDLQKEVEATGGGA